MKKIIAYALMILSLGVKAQTSVQDSLIKLSSKAAEPCLHDSLIQVGARISCPDIHLWKYPTTNLLPNERDALDFLAKTLTTHPSLVIKLYVHLDTRGSDSFNMKESKRQLAIYVDHLVKERGIAKQRIIGIPMGETQPVYSDEQIWSEKDKRKREDMHMANRRVEIEIVKI